MSSACRNLKQRLCDELIRQLEVDINMLASSLAVAVDAATHAESKPENKYDTRALEASYLAGAQQGRLVDMRTSLEQLRNMSMTKYNSETPIGPTAVVELGCASQRSHYFLLPSSAGKTLRVDHWEYQVVSMQSPLGRGLVGKLEGELVTIAIAGKEIEYEILKVI